MQDEWIPVEIINDLLTILKYLSLLVFPSSYHFLRGLVQIELHLSYSIVLTIFFSL